MQQIEGIPFEEKYYAKIEGLEDGSEYILKMYGTRITSYNVCYTKLLRPPSDPEDMVNTLAGMVMLCRLLQLKNAILVNVVIPSGMVTWVIVLLYENAPSMLFTAWPFIEVGIVMTDAVPS